MELVEGRQACYSSSYKFLTTDLLLWDALDTSCSGKVEGISLSGAEYSTQACRGARGRGVVMELLGLAAVIFYVALFVLSVIEAYRG